MKLKLTLLLILGLFVFSQNAQAAIATLTVEQFQHQTAVKNLSPEMLKMNVDQFLTLTPSKYKEMTGKRLGLVNTVKLKVAQKMLKKELKQGRGISKTAYILIAIFVMPFLAVGLATDFQGNDWVYCLLWTLLCGIPGVIYALVKMKNYKFS